MRIRNKFLYVWLILAGLAPILGALLNGNTNFEATDILNLLLGVVVNVTIWYLFIKLCYWIYDRLKKK